MAAAGQAVSGAWSVWLYATDHAWPDRTASGGYRLTSGKNSRLLGLSWISHRHVPALADRLRRVTARYDNLFEMSLPYSMGFHQIPLDGQPHPGWHLHAHFWPPTACAA